MSTVVQPCARCGARWTVQGSPMHWCPRCRGVLLSPAPIDAPAERRNYRWVARRPDHRTRKPAPAATPRTPTPRYALMPSWGLRDLPPEPAVEVEHAPSRTARWALTPLLLVTAGLFGLAAVAELLRYAILLVNRTRLIDPLTLLLSDGFVLISSIGALVFALGSAVALLLWLIETRRAAFEAAGHSDPRTPTTLALGSLIPVVNLVWPGIYLAELAQRRDDPRAGRAGRIWWCAWVLGGLLAGAALLWRTADSLQVQADGVLFAAFTDVYAAGLVILTLWTVRLFEGRDLFGRSRRSRRWVMAVDPAVPVIEPVHPGGAPDTPTRDAAEAEIAEDLDTDAAADGNRRHEEVVAK